MSQGTNQGVLPLMGLETNIISGNKLRPLLSLQDSISVAFCVFLCYRSPVGPGEPVVWSRCVAGPPRLDVHLDRESCLTGTWISQ